MVRITISDRIVFRIKRTTALPLRSLAPDFRLLSNRSILLPDGSQIPFHFIEVFIAHYTTLSRLIDGMACILTVLLPIVNRTGLLLEKKLECYESSHGVPPVHPLRLFRNRGGDARSNFLFFFFSFFNLYARVTIPTL